MKYFFTVFLLLGLFFNAHAQNAKIDSLQRELVKAKVDSMKWKLTYLIGTTYGNGINFDSAKNYLRKAILLAKKLDEQKAISSYRYLSRVFGMEGKNYDSCRYYADICYEKCVKAKDTVGIIRILGTFTSLESINKNHEAVMKNIYTALDLIDKYSKKNEDAEYFIVLESSNLGELGSLYYEQVNYKKCLEINHRRRILLEGAKNMNPNTLAEQKIHNYISFGAAHERLNQLDSALFYGLKAEKLATEYDLHGDLSYICNNIGVVYQKQKKSAEAINYYLKALESNEKANGSNYNYFNNFIFLLTEQKRCQEALKYLNKHNSFIEQSNKRDWQSLLENYNARNWVFECLGQYDSAYFYLGKSYQIKDSIYLYTNAEKTKEIEAKYETAEKESENQRLRAEKAEQANTIQKRNTMIAGVGTLFVLSLTGFGFYTYRKRHQVAQARIQKQEQVSQKIGQELHDGIAGTLLAVTKKYEQDSLLAQEISKIRSEVRFLSHQLGAFLDADLIDKLNTFIKEYKQIYPKISFDFPAPLGNWTNLDKDVQLAIYRIVQQGVTNALQHSGADQITVNLFQNKDLIELEIQDNGKGIDLENLRKGAGLLSMEDRCKVLGGKLEIIADNGTIILAKIPIKYKKI